MERPQFMRVGDKVIRVTGGNGKKSKNSKKHAKIAKLQAQLQRDKKAQKMKRRLESVENNEEA